MTIALQILEGHERGRTYSELPPPITIGREEDNTIRLNDERASRFHAKIQIDDGRVILTDLDSTNGTRVNGHIVQMRVLQPGDQILIGRSLIAYWPEEERVDSNEATIEEQSEAIVPSISGTVSSHGEDDPFPTLQREPGELFPDGPPPLPGGLSPAQLAELSDLLSYVHHGLMSVAMSSFSGDSDSPNGEHTVVPQTAWQQMVTVQRALAEYLASASDPD